MKYKRVCFQGCNPYYTLHPTQILKVSANSRKKKKKWERKGGLEEGQNLQQYLKLLHSKHSLVIDLPRNSNSKFSWLSKDASWNFKASLDPCIDKAMEVVEKKLYNQPIFNQVHSDTLSFKQPLLGQRNKPSPMHFHYHSHSLVIKRENSMFVAIFLTKLNQRSLAIFLRWDRSDETRQKRLNFNLGTQFYNNLWYCLLTSELKATWPCT